ncbi:MAG: NAD-dependent epimerase/dehydratase family protein [Saprospiraceae bacterium]|nr:NAD-dependent epimerase/dehydratase family protein [Saprospiraceae bacterium]
MPVLLVSILPGTWQKTGTTKLTIADNFARGKQDDYFTELVNKHNIRVVAGDFTDPATFNQLDEAYDQVYMLASVVGVDNANSIPHEIIRINTALIFNTLEWVRRSKVGKYCSHPPVNVTQERLKHLDMLHLHRKKYLMYTGYRASKVYLCGYQNAG